MESIALKIKSLNYSEDVYPMVNKFLSSLTDDIVSLEDLVRIVNYLNEKSINIDKPSQNKIFANDFEFIKNQVERLEEIGELDAYKEDITRINSKGAIDRLLYLKNNNLVYKNEEGKYSKLIFSKKLFEKEYGKVDLTNVENKNVADSIIEEEQIENTPTLIDQVMEAMTPSANTIPQVEVSDKKENIKIEVPDIEKPAKEEVIENVDNNYSEFEDEIFKAMATDVTDLDDNKSVETNEIEAEETVVDEAVEETTQEIETPVEEVAEVEDSNETSIQDTTEITENIPVLEETPSDEIIVENNSQEETNKIDESANVEVSTENEELEKTKENDFSYLQEMDNVVDEKDLLEETKELNIENIKNADDIEEANVETNDIEDEIDPIEAILSKEQTISFDDETYERYNKLLECIRHIMVSVYNSEEVHESISDNLTKLITNGIDDDKYVIYVAMTHQKNLPAEELERLRAAIVEEMEYLEYSEGNSLRRAA